jgi:RNA polymerase sigma-70 factor (ECF subfamily)
MEQDLVLDLLARLPSYDPARAERKTFISRVVKHRVATLLDARRAACRDVAQETLSLDAPCPVDGDADGMGEECPAGNSQVFDQDQMLMRAGVVCQTEWEHHSGRSAIATSRKPSTTSPPRSLA